MEAVELTASKSSLLHLGCIEACPCMEKAFSANSITIQALMNMFGLVNWVQIKIGIIGSYCSVAQVSISPVPDVENLSMARFLKAGT
jgi:hypothetical protein